MFYGRMGDDADDDCADLFSISEKLEQDMCPPLNSMA